MTKKILNLGCGRKLIKGAVNVDLVEVETEDKSVVYVKNDIIQFLKKQPPNYWDEIHLHYVLEHFPLEKISTIFWLCHQTLKCNGKLIIITDNFDALVEKYLKVRKEKGRLEAYLSIHYSLYASEETTYHKVCFVPELLEILLVQEGFKIEDLKDNVGAKGTSILIIASKVCEGEPEEEILKREIGIEFEFGKIREK